MYWQAWEKQAVILADGADLPEGVPTGGVFLTLRYAPRGRTRKDGSRARAVFLECPHCSRQVRAVYASRYNSDGAPAVWAGDWRKEPREDSQGTIGGGVLGCVHCLGLAYPSSQEHKTLSGDGRLLRMGKPERWQAQRQGRALERASLRLSKRCKVAFPHMF